MARRWPTSIRRSPRTRTTRQPISVAAISSAPRASFPKRSTDLNAAIRLNPEGAQAYHARGLIYQRQGNQQQAIVDFNNAIDRDPFAGAPYQARAQSYMATGKYDSAIEDYDAALNVDSNNASAWAGLGLAYEKPATRPRRWSLITARWSWTRAMPRRGPDWPG